MKLESARLLFRPLIQADAEAYSRLSQNEGFLQYQISDYRRSSQEAAEQWIEELAGDHRSNGFGILGVFRKNSGELIGLCALKRLYRDGDSPIEIMYRISDLSWGQGFGLETAATLVTFARTELRLSCLVATVDPRNLHSKKILAKLGFQFRQMIRIESLEEELHELILV